MFGTTAIFAHVVRKSLSSSAMGNNSGSYFINYFLECLPLHRFCFLIFRYFWRVLREYGACSTTDDAIVTGVVIENSLC